MSGKIPYLQVIAKTGSLILKEGLSICFYMHASHHDVAASVEQTLEIYLRAIGRHALTWYPDYEGEWQPLDDSSLEHVRQELRTHPGPHVLMRDSIGSLEAYQFQYRGVFLGPPFLAHTPPERHACAVSFWLPASYLQSQGIGPFRDLALSLARLLPFDSGHAGPSFHAWLGMEPLTQQMFNLGLRYPGMDIPDEHNNAYSVGDRLQGIHWMNFLGPSVLGELGGAEALRARLTHPGTAVQPLGEDRAVVILGDAPDAGDTSQGNVLPAYRELARVLEPWLTSREAARPYRENEALRRWERRFLD
ncbi:DUF3396 domain-containing protein [Corallococcus sp. BB11-1]|uniref:type VI immunity family protein n=1 Tax=Corallococcus sp. BB11-1 TaxID=2996783 RepID=UPI0010E4BAA9|nr:type VI immunity family protein [Corallococcus sp. BB11-1]MCY1034097.1 DUF3396 domain-containing protein [Corallococcus sp. BB11-1]RYZ17259.1 MAG: DUF3396 domain-containing protein [Myxococcaceae bacterium]